jgi:Retrotransposon gag protein
VGTTYKVEAKPSDPALGFSAEAEPFVNPVLTDMDPEKSPLAKAGVKLKHPEPYSGGSDLEEFKGFIANILRWLKMNYLLGLTSIDLQVGYLGTCLTGEAQEWIHRNVEHFERQVRDWTLETIVQGLQTRFLHTLTYHHTSNKFDAVMQGTKTVQELMNELTKYAACMMQQPDDYTLRRPFVSALRETLRNKVLKKGYCEGNPADFATLQAHVYNCHIYVYITNLSIFHKIYHN